MAKEITERPHKQVTALDFTQLERMISGLKRVSAQAAQYNDDASKRHVAFLDGAISAMGYIAGGATSNELYGALLEGQRLLQEAGLAD